jgi:hypothetical protein
MPIEVDERNHAQVGEFECFFKEFNMTSQFVKIVVFVPEADGDKVRAALGQAGAGKFGKYSNCLITVGKQYI